MPIMPIEYTCAVYLNDGLVVGYLEEAHPTSEIEGKKVFPLYSYFKVNAEKGIFDSQEDQRP